jgi:hypothetical protein
MMLRVAALAVLVDRASAHGAMTFPRPRNSLDGDLPLWTSWNYACRDGQKGSERLRRQVLRCAFYTRTGTHTRTHEQP